MTKFTTTLCLLVAVVSGFRTVNADGTPSSCTTPCTPKQLSPNNSPDALTDVICKDRPTFDAFVKCVETECKLQPTSPEVTSLTWEDVCAATGKETPNAKQA